MFWMTTLLGMLLMGAIEIASSDPDPEDEGTEPDERQTADLSGQNQFHPAKIDPSTVKPEEFSPDTSEAPLGTPTAPVRGSAAVRQMTALSAMTVPTVSMDTGAMIQFPAGAVMMIYGGETVKICCAAALAMILCTAMTAMII